MSASEDADIETRFTFRTLCSFVLVAAPLDRGPKLPACRERPLVTPPEALASQSAAFWQYWESQTDQQAQSFVSRWPSFLENARYARGRFGDAEMTSTEIAALDLEELCIEYAESKHNRDRAASELRRRKAITDMDWKRIEDGVVVIGMAETAVYCALGKPTDTNRSVGSWGVDKQLVYSGGVYVYTRNGKVTSWQD